MFNSRYHGPINEKTGTSLIIVCTDKYREHANYLQQLISQDDTKFLGTNGVTSAIYLEKEYSQNRPKLSSHQYLLFIGPSDEAKKQNETIPPKFRDGCLHYGWLGKIGTLYVDDSFKFLTWKELKRLISVNFFGCLGSIIVIHILAGLFTASLVCQKLDYNKKTQKELYRLLIKKFYKNGLKSFIARDNRPETV